MAFAVNRKKVLVQPVMTIIYPGTSQQLLGFFDRKLFIT